MKKLFTIILLLSFSISSLFPAERTLSQKKAVAASVLGLSVSKMKNVSDIVPLKTMKALTVMGYADGSGFAIIANDEAHDAVLGYSFTSFREKKPENFDWWLKCIDRSLENNAVGKADTKKIIQEKQYAKAVPQLMSTTWTQRYPFNAKCPLSSTSEDLPAGCVVTAMSQIMYYHKWPEKGIGTNEYTWIRDDNVGQVLSADFGNTYYKWDQMLDSYDYNYTDSQKDIIATLTYHCGVAVNMDYSPSGSGADLVNACTAFYKYFGYSENVQMRWSRFYGEDEWMDLVLRELNSKRPILYSGLTEAYASHAFVIDGYDATGMVHVNWGWGGDYDGMYDIRLLNPVPGTSYSVGQYMIVGIAKPSDENIPYYCELSNSSDIKFNINGDRITSDIPPIAYNESNKTIYGRFAVLIEGEGYLRELQSQDYSSSGILPGKVAIFRLYANLPSDLPDGTYRIYSAFLETGKTEWKEIRYTPGKVSGYILKKLKGEYTIESTVSGIAPVNCPDSVGEGITRVYDINGKLVYSVPSISFSEDDIPGYGIFIVRYGKDVKKVMKLR